MKTLSIPTLNSIIQDVHKADLSVEQLEELACVINAMRSLKLDDEKLQPKEEAIAPTNGSSSGKQPAKGCYEVKTIKGHQYLYLRYYKGCRNGRSLYGSKYLGKGDSKPQI